MDNDTPMLVLGIETTCDETAAAVVERQGDGSGRILSNIVRSQTSEHARFGGVVPEIASRGSFARSRKACRSVGALAAWAAGANTRPRSSKTRIRRRTTWFFGTHAGRALP